MKKRIFSVVIFMFIAMLSSAKPIELLEVPQKYQGVWKTLALSEDKGKTKIAGNGAAFCRVFSSYVLTVNGERIPFTAILQQTQGNVEYTGLNFASGLTWVISSIGGSCILVQTIETATGIEKLRVIFLVD